MTIRMHEDEIEVDDTLVRKLLRSQMPALAELPLIAVEPWGTATPSGAWVRTW